MGKKQYTLSKTNDDMWQIHCYNCGKYSHSFIVSNDDLPEKMHEISQDGWVRAYTPEEIKEQEKLLSGMQIVMDLMYNNRLMNPQS